MLSVCRSVLLAATLLLPPVVGVSQAQTFEELIEGVLGQEPDGAEQPAPPSLLEPNTPTAPSSPQLQPGEPGPRPYTPPGGGTPPTSGETDPTSGGATTDGAAAATGADAEPSGTTDAPAQAPSDAVDEAIVAPAQPGTEPTSERLRAADVNAAMFDEAALAADGANPLILKAQVLLDRAGASPGAIDARPSDNFAKAIAAVETVLGLAADGRLDAQVWQALRGDTTQDVLVPYAITPLDLSYPFTGVIPDDLAEQERLPSLGYMSVEEMLAERFHMDVALFKAINAGVDFSGVGSIVWVASVEGVPMDSRLAFVVAYRTAGQLRGYDAQNRLIAAYPATIGSGTIAPPSGEHRVELIAANPVYSFDPGALASADNSGPRLLSPGPNNPVGTVWISLANTGCGIHGTADPTTVGQEAPIGCVRLTNWDVEELAGLVAPGVIVTFVE